MFKYHLISVFILEAPSGCLLESVTDQAVLSMILCWSSTEDKSGSTGSWSGSTKHSQQNQFLASFRLTGRINYGFNIIHSAIMFLPTASNNWIRPYPSINNLQKAAYLKTAATLKHFRSSAVYLLRIIYKEFRRIWCISNISNSISN